VIVATGLLHDGEQGPEKAIDQLSPAWLARNFAVNAIGPALVAKRLLPLMPRTGKTIFAALSARVGSISDNRMGGWYGYRASKAALNQFIRTLAIEHKRRDRSIVVALHPAPSIPRCPGHSRAMSAPAACSPPTAPPYNCSTSSTDCARPTAASCSTGRARRFSPDPSNPCYDNVMTE
jgi:NAD(P)-dependent dehydrogenase (short-subunit alcohol dehydrogenase family)